MSDQFMLLVTSANEDNVVSGIIEDRGEEFVVTFKAPRVLVFTGNFSILGDDAILLSVDRAEDPIRKELLISDKPAAALRAKLNELHSQRPS